MPTEIESLCEAALAVADLAKVLDAIPLFKNPGCWEIQIDKNWWLAANGHRGMKRCSHGPEVAPFNFYVEWCGFPAGSFDSFGGVIAAGELANEQTFIEAVKKRIAKESSS